MNKDHKRPERKLALREKNLASNLQIRHACPVEVVVSGHGTLSSANNFRAPGRRGWTHELKVLFPWALHLVTNMPCWGKVLSLEPKVAYSVGKKFQTSHSGNSAIKILTVGIWLTGCRNNQQDDCICQETFESPKKVLEILGDKQLYKLYFYKLCVCVYIYIYKYFIPK